MTRRKFPLHIVTRSIESEAAGARRHSGIPLAQGLWRHSTSGLGDDRWSPPLDTGEPIVHEGAAWWEHAWSDVFRRFIGHPVIRKIETGLTRCDLTVRFMKTGDSLLAVAMDTGVVEIAADLPGSLGLAPEAPRNEMAADDRRRGFTLLLGLGLVHVLLCRCGCSQRAALHGMLELFQDYSPDEYSCLFRVLDSPFLDPGKLFSLFLKRAGSSGSPQERDRHITWLLGQERVDLPYDRVAALAILGGPADADEKRRQLYGLVRDYDHTLEQGNIERVSIELREAGELLIFGRMSRAFHNQGLLFADAVLLCPKPEWLGLADELAGLSAGDDSTITAAGTLRLLLNSPAEVPLIQLEGALERFEDAVLDAQRRALAEALKPAREHIENHADSLVSTSLPHWDAGSIFQRAEDHLRLAERLRQSLVDAPRRPAAYVVVSQRPSPTGAHLLVKLNEFEDPYAGKPDNLQKLLRLAGDRIYGSPDYGWLKVADHWIEAIPLFIKENVRIENGEETTRTVIDIAGMEESFREEMADLWADNLCRVQDSEFLALARQCLAKAAEDIDEEALRRRFLAEGADPKEIAALGFLFAEAYRRHAGEVQRLVEREELPPFEAARLILPGTDLVRQVQKRREGLASWRAAVVRVLREADCTADLEAEIARLVPEALSPRRPLPALHVLTTQSAGMTEGYIRTWLEESMALYNVVKEFGLQEAVENRRRWHAARVRALSEKLIRELGLWVEVEELRASDALSKAEAIRCVVARNLVLQKEIACLGTLLEHEAPAQEPAECVDDPESVTVLLHCEAEILREAALDHVLKRNGEILRRGAEDCRRRHPDIDEREALRRVVTEDDFYRRDLEAYVRIAARRRALERLDTERPELHLRERQRSFLRRYRNLSKTTARKEVIAERGLNPLTLHPLHYFRATGGGKRYQLLYTPSRVDLGQRERESVETWAQWVGGADRAAAREGGRLYALINKNVRVFESLTEPEVLKTGENASMASHYAFSNALSLMMSATRRGDFESMADQMNRRRDRQIHPAGEGYGGYCVPKDGLFLEFVLSLGQAEKLSQIGLPEACHESALRLVHELLDRRGKFSSHLDWEAWASVRMREAEVLPSAAVFQATRIALVLEGLGQPELRDPARIATSLAARWGLHKMVTGGEQVNRFMPFFKVWLIRQALAESARRHPGVDSAPEQAVVVLTAEYKPDTQDGRFSAGMRKLEILAGTDDHLLSALDAEGQDLAMLLGRGYAELERLGRTERILQWLDIDPADEAAAARLRSLFPATLPPAEIRMVSPMGLSPQDLMTYTSDTRLGEAAEAARAELLASGFSVKEIEANLRTHGPRLEHWHHRRSLSLPEREKLRVRLGGSIHALSLAVLGPELDYSRALQGADVLDTGIPHRVLLELLTDPGWLCGLMLAGNPHSALAIVDGASGARPRSMNRLDVMLWFAAGERRSREPIYLGIGLGQDTVESWRATMRRRLRWAEGLLRALADGNGDEARQVYGRIVRDLREQETARAELDETDKLARIGRARERDRVYAEFLAQIAAGLPLESLDFAGFLALGGVFLLVGADHEEITACRSSVELGVARLGGRPPAAGEHWRPLLPRTERVAMAEFREERGVESSNKAMEERPTVALETRRQLAGRLARARGLNERRAAFAAVSKANGDFSERYAEAMDALGSADAPVSEAAFGRFMGHARNALAALALETGNEEHRLKFLARLDQLCTGHRLDPGLWQGIAGSYEDIGDFGRLAQSLAGRTRRGEIDATERRSRLERIALGVELFEILLAVDSIQEILGDTSTDSLWRALVDFFAKTLNDHHYEYRPWLYSRGVGFADLSGDELYRLAAARHAWLYRYLRSIVIRYTELRELPPAEQDSLLGNFLDGKSVEAIGAEADSIDERAWRAYGQIRELAFIRNDGFPLPVVFPEFDPALIEDGLRINHVVAAPVGRTHFSRMLREGPTLAGELKGEGRPGANLIISRKIDFHRAPGLFRSVARVRSGHFYLDAEDYHAACSRYKPGSAAVEVPPKGIRVAARFTRPVQAALVYPFHGDPAYTSGAMEAAGLPYTVQSLFHTWTTYDKAKYSDIFRDSAVELPAEIDWLASWTALADEATVKGWIREGLPGGDYPGLEGFAGRHPQVIVKDAAESGGRNMRAFAFRNTEGHIDEGRLAEAVDFIFQISLKHNAAIQEVVHGSPELWATEAFMEDFVRRQIVEWGQPVERRREPRPPIHGSVRVILSTDNPDEPDFQKKWHCSHWITLNSRHLITNIGRGGSLEQLLPEFIRPEHRDLLIDRLSEAGRRAAEALSDYESRAGEAYRRETGRAVGADLMGISYGKPRYLMLDFLVAPMFAEQGNLVDIRPRYGEDGMRLGSEFILQRDGRSFPGTVSDWRVVLIEPNIGVGLWDRVALREEAHELRRAQADGREPDWSRVGTEARIVLRDLSRAGEQYLRKLQENHDGIF